MVKLLVIVTNLVEVYVNVLVIGGRLVVSVLVIVIVTFKR